MKLCIWESTLVIRSTPTFWAPLAGQSHSPLSFHVFMDSRSTSTPRTPSPTVRTLDQAISKAQEKSSIPAIVALSAVVICCVAGLSLTVLLYLFAIHNTSLEGVVLVSSARLQLVTAITQALSTCVTRVIPIIVSIYAYSIAVEWLAISRMPDSPERPTALQCVPSKHVVSPYLICDLSLGLLMTVIQGAGVFSWITTATQVSRLKRSYQQSSRSVPRILRRSISVIGLILLLSCLTSLFDTWLHVASTNEVVRFEEPYSSSDFLFGKTINETRCAYYSAKDPANLDPMSSLCGLFQTSSLSSYDLSASINEATLTLGNASESNFVQLTDDQHAILVPAAIPAQVAYNASTIGVKSQCRGYVLLC